MYFPKDKIIFIAINKTGSTSVLHALNDTFYDPDVPEMWQLDSNPGSGRVHEYLKHAQAYFYSHILGPEEFHRCFSFSMVRNPWDKMVSDFFFRCRSPKEPEIWRGNRKWFVKNGMTEPTNKPDIELFKLYIRALYHHELTPHGHWGAMTRKFNMPDTQKANINQLDGLTDLQDRIMVNKIMKLEEISRDWPLIQSTVKEKTGKELGDLPHVNQSERDDYRTYYDDETRTRVEQMFTRDIEHFQYKF